MRTIPQLLRTRNSGAVGTTLPELGALLGRGSFGKVYKGARSSPRFLSQAHLSLLAGCLGCTCRPWNIAGGLISAKLALLQGAGRAPWWR